ncbi:hypothetical protein BT96DRAFT_935918 [Gymnopus androsaceus JB14]|uniref:Uncharacterized protein n=1 Tax=Gymnopus androsaceus JB14 TaxID=1447944 RepID=A0A6A4I2H9_9AGAR|nr:hypothetical protein BT96DRAFT_935918 [Gymnopus androsaceus JB14]
MLDDRDMAAGMSRKKLRKKRRAEMRAQATEKEQAENVRVGMDACRKELECMWKGLGEGTRLTSWIWMEGGGELIDQEALAEGIRVEWCKDWEQQADYGGPFSVRKDEEHRERVVGVEDAKNVEMMDEPGESKDAITNNQENYNDDGDEQEEEQEQEQEE